MAVKKITIIEYTNPNSEGFSPTLANLDNILWDVVERKFFEDNKLLLYSRQGNEESTLTKQELVFDNLNSLLEFHNTIFTIRDENGELLYPKYMNEYLKLCYENKLKFSETYDFNFEI